MRWISSARSSRPAAKNPLRLLRRRQIIALLLAIMLTAAVVVTAYQVVLNVGAVHSFFFPIQWIHVENTTDWTPVQFKTGEFLILNSGLCDKAVTNHERLRHPDPRAGCRRESGGGDARHRPDTSAQLSMLERNTPYRVEALAGPGSVILTFH